MPTKKKSAPKKPAKKKAAPKAPPPQSGSLRAVVALILLFAAVIGLVYVADRYLSQAPKTTAQKPSPVPTKTSVTHKPARPAPVFEVYTEDAHLPPPAPLPPPPETSGPMAALIIDDLGYDMSLAEAFVSLPGSLTLSVLPLAPHSGDIARMAHSSGKEVLLHLPMEPKQYPKVNPGPGTLLTSMDTDTILSLFKSNLADVPYAAGVNNHMGSAMTADSQALYPIFTLMKKKGLFFVDSRTSADTQARGAARLLQLPFAQRDVFLDHEPNRAFIEGQLKTLKALAIKHGHAVGIAHPHPVTLEVLEKNLPAFEKDVTVVAVSRIVGIVE